MKILSKLLMLVLALLLVACSSPDSGEKYLGDWINPKNPRETFTILRNGDGFLLNGPIGKIAATLKDGQLQSGSGITFTYVEATDTLVSGNGFSEFIRKR